MHTIDVNPIPFCAKKKKERNKHKEDPSWLKIPKKRGNSKINPARKSLFRILNFMLN